MTHLAQAYPSLGNMWNWEYFYYPLAEMLVYHKDYLKHYLASIHLWVERDNMNNIACLRKQHNYWTRSQTPTLISEAKWLEHYKTTP